MFNPDVIKEGKNFHALRFPRNWGRYVMLHRPSEREEGWLMIYHGVDKNLSTVRGAALLDLADPSKVIVRLPYPILEPERDYKNSATYPTSSPPLPTSSWTTKSSLLWRSGQGLLSRQG